ncbi:hypothetical protein D0Z07_4357 [Hyphodiscus hymeniophilus]|uniref:DUF2415 domain-containing protein n=1 Tax=Hyphodiscus hymeniophilus TaxID=353542 RepID=A0A9P6VJE6_9HELO|nr:hypothetical protein D0Z07_4357 [Hyphodiscus hymeniophilus]
MLPVLTSRTRYHATEDLILRSPRKYYRASIHTSHWQLRDLISSPEQDVVFYPSGQDVYSINTRTNEKAIVTSVDFTPRCLTVARGWLCCGGDVGRFAVVNLKDGKTVSESSLHLNLESDPDARLPLDLDPLRRVLTPNMAPYLRRTRNSYPLTAIEKKVGTELVNCTTLWFPKETISDGVYKSPVAVVANNDCTVSILYLEDEAEILDKLKFPDFVNRSVMSPDGTLLVTICDDPFLYLHYRRQKAALKGCINRNQEYEWIKWGRIQLEGQHRADKSNMRGSFAASFSKSGKYLAVATQYGMISVFDVGTMTQDGVEPLAIFTSSRPGRECGAIRSMEFSPEPFDLLAWTESSGRITVADVRNCFLSRQHVVIDSRADDVERILVSDGASEPVIDPRLRSFRTESPSLSSTTPDYLGLGLDRRQLGHLSRLMLDRQQTPLTPEELEVVSVSTLARRQRDEAAGTSAWGSIVRGQRQAATGASTNGEGSSTNDRRISTAGYPAALRDFINPERNAAASFRSFINERNQERDRRMQQQQEPRRRSSIILAAAEQSIERETLSSISTRNTPETTLERLTLTPPRLLDSPSNPWADSDPPYRSRHPTSPPVDRATRLRIEVEDDDRRDFAHRLRQPWRPIDDFNQTGIGGHDELTVNVRGVIRPGPIETMGCCWSPDGRIL